LEMYLPLGMQRAYTGNIDSADVSHTAFIILLDILCSPETLLVGNALTIFKNSSRDEELTEA
jgi:hypothetical protein